MKKQDLCQSDKLSNAASEARFFSEGLFAEVKHLGRPFFISFIAFFFHDHSNARGLGFKPFQCLSDTRGKRGKRGGGFLTRRRMLNYFPSLVLNVKLWKKK